MTSANDELEARALAIVDAALAMPRDEREDFVRQEAGDEIALKDRALTLLAKLQADIGSDLKTAGGAQLFEEVVRPEAIGPYAVESEIGRGGMGVVYLGRRSNVDFEHQVAIKLVSEIRQTPRLTERLLSERRVLARLSHPHIAQFYDGGETDDGRPYFVMEYVEGAPLRTFLSQTSVGLDDRLRIFREICSGVAYAHSNLIVHRDLSPANILVSSEGAAKVIDFGVSHTIGEEGDDSTRLTYTEGFTAPERLRGDPATTLSDIYSLGVVFSELLKDVRGPRLDDLHAIAQRAAAASPEERYQSVGAILDDLDRYHEIRPVTAVENSWRYRGARLFERRRLRVLASVVAVLGIIGTSIVTSVLFVRAQTAEQEAQQRFDEVRSLARTLMFDIYDSVENLTGGFEARSIVIETVQNYLDTVSALETSQADLRLEAALGYHRLADVQGDFTGASQGRVRESQENIEAALSLVEAVLSEAPGSPEANHVKATIREWQASNALFRARDTELAMELAFDAAAVIGQALAADPDNTAYQKTNLAILKITAQINQYGGNGSEAAAGFADAIEAAETLLTVDNDERGLQIIANLKRDLGTLLIDLEREEEAIAMLSDALRDIDGFIAAFPEDQDGQHVKMVSAWQLAIAQQRLERYDEASEAISVAMQIARAAAASDIGNVNARRELAVISATAAELDVIAGRIDQAKETADAVLTAFQQPYTEDPDNPGFAMDVAYAYDFIAGFYESIDDQPAACQFYRDGVPIFEDLAAKDALTPYDQEFYAVYQEKMSGC
ncbi:MAG: serine/threonine-protein kinase [Pseudomonadota bacterium]